MRERSDPAGSESLADLDVTYLNRIEAAEGYHMLGQYQEAADEIAGLPPGPRYDPRALFVACRAYWALRQMPEALIATDRYIQAAPDQPFGYIFKAMLLSCLAGL